jgi:hypothetical protein
MEPLYRYRLRGYSRSIPSRIIHLSVTASSADDARRMAQIRNPDFGTTLPRQGIRRGGRVVEEPESADGMTQAKAREYVEWRGCEVEVV